MDTHNLELYYFNSCPYCQKVISFLNKHNISLTMKNIKQDKKATRKLIEIGGKKQVPCLFINEKPMYESDDIINWLKNEVI